ncbi:MAG: hypothetical protein D6766_12200 [Verrucomicrobia bacterium]|nr:MAG: hypothetical protein D6766_12200 [Verrucomicrobiota bacterium]
MLPSALALRLDRSGRMMWVCRQRIRRWLGRRRLFPPLWQRFLLRWWRPWVNDSPAPPSWRSAATDAWWLSPANPARVAETSPAAQPSGPETDPACDPGPNLCEIMRRSFDAAHRHLHHQAATLGLDPAGLSCTALALLLDCETGELVAGQVGDGAILALSASGEVRELVSPPETGDAQTTFTLNAPDYAATLAVAQVHPAKCDPVEALFVMTDGLAGDLLYSAEPGALNTWARQVHHNLRHSPTPAAAAAGMLNWLAGYHVPGSWDDRTLVVLTLDHPAHAHRPTR